MRPASFLRWIARPLSLVLTASLTLPVTAASREAPPAAHWVPAETLAFLSFPNLAHTRDLWGHQAVARAWTDPSMAPFRNQFLDRWHHHVLMPLQALTGIDGPAWMNVAIGQWTLALIPDPPNAEGRPGPIAPLLLMDAGPHRPHFETRLAALAALPETRRTSIGGVPFHTVPLDPVRLRTSLDAAFPRTGPAPAPQPFPDPDALHVGMLHANLLVSTSIPALEAALAGLDRSASHPVPVPPWLSTTPPPDDTLLHAALNVPAWLNRLSATRSLHRPFPALPPLPRMVDALGLKAVRSASLALRATSSSSCRLDFHLAVPAAERRGLLALLAPGPGTLVPPDFIPAQAQSFQRLRRDGPEAWTRFERLLRDLNPSLLGMLQLFTGTAGLREDPNFNFRRDLIDRLGDDWIVATVSGSSTNSPPTRTLFVGTRDSAALTHALKLVATPDAIAAFLPPNAPAPTRDTRIWNGNPWVSLTLPALPWPWPPGSTGLVHVAATPGYVAVSPDAQVMERLLTQPTIPGPLRSDPRFRAALTLAGGPEGGYLAYHNLQSLALRFGPPGNPLAAALAHATRWAALTETTARAAAALNSWMDPRLLPNPSTVAPGLGIAVHRGWADANGLRLTVIHLPPPEG
ncbi:MAG: hypothetical protein KF833_12900 [Verrucomicrobiae bacterium]|nr:hypothetical protein [Verrucomicrobiae bacterium]